MSEVVRKVDKKVAAIIDENDERYGSSLMAPLRLEEYLHSVVMWMQGPRALPNENVNVPRFGLLSLILSQTPVFVYGHPALKKVSRTAFTDGVHIFICDEFFDKLNDDVSENKSTYGIEFLLMHEIMHKLFNHTRRLRRFPNPIPNQATDLSINTKLSAGFPDIEPCKTLTETGLGFKAGDQDRWMHLSEESIASDLLAELGFQKQRKQEGDGQGKPQQGGGGGQGGQGQGGKSKGGQQGGSGGSPGQSGSGGQEEKEDEDPLAENESGGGKGQDQDGAGGKGGKQQGGGKGSQQGGGEQGDQEGQGGGGNEEGDEEGDDPSDDFGDENDNHFIDLPDFIKILEENGLDHVREKLELPKSDDLDSIGELEESTRLAQTEAIMAAASQRAQVGGKYPGAHIVDSAGFMVTNFAKGKLTWKMALREGVLGHSTKYRPSIEDPNEILYIDEVTGMLGTELFLPTELPHKVDEAVVCLIDTSGSMGDPDLKEVTSEVLELKTAAGNMGDAASEIFLFAADTVLRGEMIEINEHTIGDLQSKGVKLAGRGGTDLEHCMLQALAQPILKEKKVKLLIYFTDTYDSPPKRPKDLPTDMRIIFLAPSSVPASSVEVFSKGVAEWAEVFQVEEDLVIDLSVSREENRQAISPARRARRR